jgi:hypothetical protein
VLLFPLVAALAITRGQPEPRERLIAGIVVLLVTGPIWLSALLGDSSGRDSGSAGAGVSQPGAESRTEAQSEQGTKFEPEPEAAEEQERIQEPEPASDDTDATSVDVAEAGSASESSTLDQMPESASQSDSAASDARAPPVETSEGVLVASLLAELTVSPEQAAGYDRDLFPHWTTQNGCNTRSRVLIAESTVAAARNSNCTITSGRWYSHFDAVWVDVPRSLDVDHMVPLAEAWRSGARNWTESARRAYANDLDDPRSLIAVTASSNRSKSDRDPANWLPSNTAYRCEYVGAWVAIKYRWELSIDSRERVAIERVLSGCGELRTSASEPARPAAGPTPEPSPAPAPAPAPEPAPAPTPAAGCVNINTASLEELQQIIHIGPARAADLISLRPFSSVDSLTRISGIGSGRLDDIKAQGLACVG